MLVAGLLPWAGALAARTPFQVRCEDEIGKTVSVLTARNYGYSVDNRLSYRTLSQMKGVAGAQTHVLGLTKTESRVEIELGGPVLQDAGSGYECIAPRITVSLFYVPIVIYVGSEFEPDSCAYREILNHELRHMQSYLDHLPKVETVVRAALAKRFGGKQFYAPAGNASAALEHEINSQWMPYIKGEMSKVERQQVAIDSPQEYARLGRSCQGEIQSIIAPNRRGR